MNRFTNPIIWLYRIKHRCGYGVHSPFAFRFISDILYESLPYYAYRELDKDLSWKEMFRIRKHLHLLLRVSNWQQPKLIYCPASSNDVMRYLKAGCKKATITDIIKEEKIDLCWLNKPSEEIITYLHEHSILILGNLREHKEWFLSLPSVVSFDLYDVGIAFFDPKYNKQHYIINF